MWSNWERIQGVWDLVHWLNAIQCRPKDARPLSTRTEDEADTALADLAREIDNLSRQPPALEVKSTRPPNPSYEKPEASGGMTTPRYMQYTP